MGQTNTSTILRQEALNLAQKNQKWRVINDAYEINQCLLMSSVIDQISYDLSSVSYKVSSMTVNPLTYDAVSSELLMKEDKIQMQSKIMYKYEVLRPYLKQRKYKTVTTQTELTSNDEIFQYSSDRKQQRNNHSFGSEIIYNYQVEERGKSQTDEKPNKKDQRQKGEKIFQQAKEPKKINNKRSNSLEKTNIFKLVNEQTENFSNDQVENTSLLSISQNFANLKSHPSHIDERSYIQNDRYWSSSHSSTFIDIPVNAGYRSQTQKNLSQNHQQQQNNVDQKTQQKTMNFQDDNQRLTQQQSFGQLKIIALQQQQQQQQLQQKQQQQQQQQQQLQQQQQQQQQQYQQQQQQQYQQQQQKYQQQEQKQNNKLTQQQDQMQFQQQQSYQQQQQQQIQQHYQQQQEQNQQQLLFQNQEKVSQNNQYNKGGNNLGFNNPMINNLQIESSPHQGYTQIHSNKKKNQFSNQFGTAPLNNFSQQQQRNPIVQSQQYQQSPKQQVQFQQGSPQASIQQSLQSSQGQQKESMRQQFDRLLRESQSQKDYWKLIKPKNIKTPVDSEGDQNKEQQKKKQKSPDYYSKLKQNHLKKSQSPVSLKMKQQNLYINKHQQHQDQQCEVVNAINISPEKQIQTLQDARQNQQQLRIQNKQQHNLNLEELNYKIQDIQKLNSQLDEKSNKLFGQIKQDVSNLQTAITQNISPSERGLRKKDTIKNGINLDDLLDYEQGSINLDELASYRGSQEYKVLDNYQNF